MNISPQEFGCQQSENLGRTKKEGIAILHRHKRVQVY